MDTLFTNIFGGTFIAVGILIVALFASKILPAMKSRHWPTTGGQLISADLKSKIVTTGTDSSGLADSAVSVTADFSYTYSVNGKDYNGKRVTYSDHVNKTTSSLSKLKDKYKGQSIIVVYYNPQNHAQSVLLPGASIYNFTPLITPALMIAAGFYVMTLT